MAKGFPNTGATVIDSSADLPAASAALEGVMMFQKDTNELKICDGAAWIPMQNYAAMNSYTPVLTGSITNPTLGTGSSVVGTYALLGKLALVSFSINFGTSGVSAGGGNYWISLPTAAPMSSNIIWSGSGFIYDASDSSRRYLTLMERADNTKVLIIYQGTSFGVVSANAPFVFAASDGIIGSLVYWTT